jgi:ankyrin repeat protein
MNRFSIAMVGMIILLRPLAVAFADTSNIYLDQDILNRLDEEIQQCTPDEVLARQLDHDPDFSVNVRLIVDGQSMKTPLEEVLSAPLQEGCDDHSTLLIDLAKRGADFNMRNLQDLLPLDEAIDSGNEYSVRFLLQRPEVRLDNFISKSFMATTEILCEDCSYVEFLAASQKLSPDLWTLLVESRKVKVDQGGSDGTTPLIAASAFGNTNAVKALLEGGANPNAINSKGYTPLRAVQEADTNGAFSAIVYHQAGPTDAVSSEGPSVSADVRSEIEDTLRKAGALK